MRTETSIGAPTIAQLAAQARRLEALGYDSITTGEVAHDPFLPLMIVAEHTQSLRLGTGVAIAFPRSPFVIAQAAWDLQRYANGRFYLGLGTQIKHDNEERYSTPWPSAPGPRLRDYILCLRAIFETFQTGTPPAFRGNHYRFTTMEPMFNPGPNPNGRVPIYIAAVNRNLCRLAGELCDGIRMHPFNTPRYAREVILPYVQEGARKAGRNISDIDVVGIITLITGRDEGEIQHAKAPIRQRLAYLGATRTYLQPVFNLYGWGDMADRLHRLADEGKWGDLAKEISDEMLDEFAVIGTYEQLVPKIKERYSGVITTANFQLSVQGPEDEERLQWLIQEVKKL